jgi:glycerophosphoryl diester phosphodiesterase
LTTVISQARAFDKRWMMRTGMMLEKPFFHSLPRVAHVSHRGGSALAPENTLAAFRRAITLWRTDQLELDVRLSRDGVPVVIHDDRVDRTTNGAGRVRDLTVYELQALDAGFRFSPDGQSTPFRGAGVRIPTLAEVLSDSGVPAMIDLKDSDQRAREAVTTVVAETGAADRVCLGTSSDDDARALARLAPDVALFFPQQAARLFVAAALAGETPPQTPFDVLALPARGDGIDVVSEPVLAAARAQGHLVQVWTVDDPASMALYLDRGVDGIQTDRPDLLRAVLDRRSGRTGERW